MVFGGVQCKMIGMTRFQKAGASNTAVLQVAESAKVRAWRALIFCATGLLLSGFLGAMPFWHLLEDQARDSLTQKFLTSKATHPQVEQQVPFKHPTTEKCYWALQWPCPAFTF